MTLSSDSLEFYTSLELVRARLAVLQKEGKELRRALKSCSDAERAALNERGQAMEAEMSALASQMSFLKKG